MYEDGSLSLTTTVLLSGAVIEIMGAAGFTLLEFAALLLGVVAFSYFVQVTATSSASSARPLIGALFCHLTPWRSLNVICVLSGFSSQDSASSGSTSDHVEGFATPGLLRTRAS